MKTSKEQLNNLIKLYLNDIEDYGCSDNYQTLAESVLNNLKKSLLTENISDIKRNINEIISNESKQNGEILNDFLLYVENI